MAQLAVRGLLRNMQRKSFFCSVSGFHSNFNKGCSKSVTNGPTLTLEETVDFSIHGPSLQGIQGGHDQHLEISEPPVQTNITSDAEDTQVADTLNCHASVNLHSTMQSNVPEPCDVKIDFAEHFNMPGGGVKQYDKYIQEVHIASHPRDN